MKISHTKKICAVLAASAAVLGVCFAPSSAADINDATVQSYEAQIADLESKQAEAQSRIDATAGELDSAIEHKQAIDDSIEYTVRKINIAQQMLAELDAEIADKEALIEETEAKIGDQREAFLGRVAALAEDGNVSYIELIFGSTSISDFLSKLDYVNSMMDYDQRVINDLKTSKQTIADSIAEIEASKKVQEETIEQLEAERVYLAGAAEDSMNVLTELQKDKNAWEAEYNTFISAENDLNDQLQSYIVERQKQIDLEEMQRQVEEAKRQEEEQWQQPVYEPAQPNVEIVDDGNFMWPLDPSISGISSHFGWRVLNGYEEFDGAVDIWAALGTPIMASNSGVVMQSEEHYSYGNYVLIDHGGSYSTLYAHMSARNVAVGDYVEKGQVIGYVGLTGRTFGEHLHFEFRVNGERVDPEMYVPAPY
ncbi:MAG: peptidoglycan DD-metalloendopeptidase family protein [Clostridia bacterium]|nr:peptidoglycan DD-metalloendopeptidase family protein [Clostridia bacterium]